MFIKAALAQGFSQFEVSQVRHYAEEGRKGAYAIGAPIDHVLEVSGEREAWFARTRLRVRIDGGTAGKFWL